jgi:hypothetical protein
VPGDLEAAMRTYVDDYGIGPWDIHEFNPGNVKDLSEYGQPVECSLAPRGRDGRPGDVGVHHIGVPGIADSWRSSPAAER